MPRHFTISLLAIALVSTYSLGWAEEDWPAWRGPSRDGVSAADGIPSTWSPTENVAWRVVMPGPAGATPVAADGRIFVTSTGGEAQEEMRLLSVSTDGEVLWDRVVGRADRQYRNPECTAAAPSPVTDGRHVWAFYGSGDFACYDRDGNRLWHRDIEQDYGDFELSFGMTSTPLLDGGCLYLQLIHDGGHFVLALDKQTGREVWRADRPSDAVKECRHAYASIQLYRDATRSFLVSHGADYVIAHRLEDGSEIWRCGGLHPARGYDPTLRFVASPLVVPGLIVAPSAKKGPTVALRPDGEGDITGRPRFHLWRHDVTPDVPSPLHHDGLVYICRENGNLICLDAETGDEYYHERTHVHRHRASPLYVDGKILLTARDGTITVVRPGKTFEVIATNEMDEPTMSSPIVVDGMLLIRTFEHLYAIASD